MFKTVEELKLEKKVLEAQKEEMIYNLEDLLLAKEELEMSMAVLTSATLEEVHYYALSVLAEEHDELESLITHTKIALQEMEEDLAAINCLLDEVKKTYVYVIFE